MWDVSRKWAHPVPRVFSSYCSEDTHVETFLQKHDIQHQKLMQAVQKYLCFLRIFLWMDVCRVLSLQLFMLHDDLFRWYPPLQGVLIRWFCICVFTCICICICDCISMSICINIRISLQLFMLHNPLRRYPHLQDMLINWINADQSCIFTLSFAEYLYG